MKVLSERSCPSEAAGTPRLSPTLRFVPEICTEDVFDHANSSTAPDRMAGDGDEACSTEDPNRSSDEAAEIEVLGRSDAGSGGGDDEEEEVKEEEEGDDDDDDDEIQWANAEPIIRPAPRNSGGRGSGRGRSLSGKEKGRLCRKTAPSPRAIAHQQHSGLVPFSGSLAPPTRKKNLRRRPRRAPSIIPANFRRKKGVNGGDPMSPDVTCLGRIKSRKLDSIRAPRAICAEWRTGKKAKCLEAKNHLCERACKCRKKSRRRLGSTDAKSAPAEWAQTRRERAASLATSLTDMLEEMRHSEDRSSYEPSAPPPNSLLLMRGFRHRSMDLGTDNALPVTNREEMTQALPSNSLLLMRGRRVRGSFSHHVEALADEVRSMKSEVEEVLCAAPAPAPAPSSANAFQVKNQKSRASGHISLLDLIEEEERTMDEAVSASELHNSAVEKVTETAHMGQEGMEIMSQDSETLRGEASQPRLTLYEKRFCTELSPIEVSRRTNFDG